MKLKKVWETLTPKEKLARWEHVRDVMVRMTPHEKRKHFDLGDWGTKNECGTIACVAGHCGLDPKFRRLGFKLDFRLVPIEYRDNPTTIEFETIEDIGAAADEFFGNEGSYRIFLGRDVRGRQSHGESVKAINRYIGILKRRLKNPRYDDGKSGYHSEASDYHNHNEEVY